MKERMNKYIYKYFNIGIFYLTFYKLGNRWAMLFEIHTKNWR